MTCVCACERPAVEDGEVLSPCPCSLSVPCVNSIANIAHSVHAATHPNEDGEIDEHSQGYSTSDDVPVVQPDSALHLSHCNRHAIDTHCATYRSWHLSRIPRPSQLPSALLNLDAGAGTGTGTGAGTGTGTDIDGHVVEIPHISEHNIDNDHDDSKNDMRDLDMFPSRPSHSLRAVDHHVDCLALKNSQTPRSPVHSQTTKENNTTLKTHCSPPTYQPVVIDLVSDQSSSSGSHNYADGEISDGSAHEDSDHHSLSEDSSHSLRTPPHSDTQQHSLSLPEYALPTSTILYPTSRDILPDSSHPVTVPWQSPIIPQPPLIPPFSKCVNFDQQTRALPSVSASLVSFPAPASMAFGVSIPSFDSPPSHHARSNIYSPSAASIRVFNPIFSKDNCTNICQHGQSACPTCLPSETRQCRDGQDSKQDNNRYCHHDANETSSSSAASVEESPRKRLRVSSPLLLDQNPSCNPLTFVMPSEQMSDPSRLSADARDNDVPASVYGGSQSKPCPAGSRPSVPQSAGTLHNTEQPSKRQLDLKAMKEAALKSSLLRKSRLSTLDKPLPTSEESIDKILFLYDDEDSSVCESEDNSRVSSAKSGCEGNCIARSLDDTHAVSRSSLPGAIDSPSTDCMSSVLQKRLELERLRRQILEREEERRIQAVQQGAPLPVLRRSLGSSAGTRQSLPRVDDARKSGSAARSAQADISQERDELLRRISELEEAKLSARRQGKRQKKSAGGALDSAKENNIACINDYDDARHSTTDSSAEDVPQDVKRIEEGEHPKHSGRSASQQMREVIDENVGAVHGEKCAADAQNTKSSKRRRLAVSKLPRFCDVPQTETSKDDRDVSSTAANKNSSGVTVLVDVLSSREHGLCLNADDQTESKSLNFHHDHKPSEKGSSAPWNESENIRDNFSSSPKGTAYRDQLARSDILAEMQSQIISLTQENKELRDANEAIGLVSEAETAHARAAARHEAAVAHVQLCRRNLEFAIAEEKRLSENAQKFCSAARTMRAAWLGDYSEAEMICADILENAERAILKPNHDDDVLSEFCRESNSTLQTTGTMDELNKQTQSESLSLLSPPTPYFSTLTERYRSPLLASRMYTLRRSLRVDGSLDKRTVAELLSARKLLPDRVLCKFDLHGTCASNACKDVHVDDVILNRSGELLMTDLEECILESCRSRAPFTQEMLQKALTAQVTIAQHAISQGQNFCDVLRTFLTAIFPLCDTYTS